MHKIIFYTTHCPKCSVLETKLKAKNISYEVCSDIDLMIQKGLSSAPALEVDGKLMKFSEAISYINEIQV